MDSITKGFFSSFTFNGCRRCCCSCPKVDKQPLTHSHTPIDSRWQLLLQHPFVTKHKKSLKRASERRSLAASSSSCFFVFCRRRETTLRRTSTTTSADHRRHRGLSARAFRETSRRPASKTWRRRILKMLKRWLKLNSWFVLVLFCEDVSKSSVGCSKSWTRKVVHAKKVCAVSCGQQNHNEELN